MDFRPPSPKTSIVHCLSGPTSMPIAPRLPPCSWSPWSVLQDGRDKYLLSTCTFVSHLLIFSHFDRSTRSLSVTVTYLALDRRNHPPSDCTTKQPYSPNSYKTPSYGTLTLYGQPSQHSSEKISYNPTRRKTAITIGANPISLAATQGILVSFFSFPY